MKWTSRILILAVFSAAVMCGCQKAPKSGASKEKGTEATSKTSAAGAKHATSGTKSSKGSVKSASTGEKTAKAKGASAKTANKTEKVESARAEHPGTLTQADDGRSFNVRQGEVIVVRLDSNHSAGFNWVVTDGPGPQFKQDGSPAYARTMTKKGKAVGGTETWRFRAVSPGQGMVRMEYRRSWERNVPERTFRFTATVL